MGPARYHFIHLALALPAVMGCYVVPEIAHQPMVHNPFPQLSKVAVAPFFNLSTEPSVDGRLVALAYFNELQAVQGYEVVPVGVVEQAMAAFDISLSNPDDARRLAQALQVDAVVVGAVTDFDPYFPPRMTLQVEWYAANPCFHPIPPGYGLPWHTSEEDLIPNRLRLAAEMAAAKAQLAAQTPRPPAAAPAVEEGLQGGGADSESSNTAGAGGAARQAALFHDGHGGGGPASGLRDLGRVTGPPCTTDGPAGTAACPGAPGQPALSTPWTEGECWPSREPVLRHVAAFDSRDDHFSAALKSYVSFREPISAGGAEGYLHRMPDFIRFCCRYHIYEMLSARGGADETRVVYRWVKYR